LSQLQIAMLLYINSWSILVEAGRIELPSEIV